jgi:protein tyrosine phosphatase (PTP) superfamily phosphohydrolase (DUF442 family)
LETGNAGKLHMMRAFWISDHAAVRKLLPNIYEVDEGIIRGGHPDRARLKKLKNAGIKSILNLRGDFDTAPNIIEKAACAELDLGLAFVALRATAPPEPPQLLQAIDLLKNLPRPLFVHCKSGADRTALAMVLYLVIIKGIDIKVARRMCFKFKYGHIRWSKAKILHQFLDSYESAAERSPISLEEWIAKQYDPTTLKQVN